MTLSPGASAAVGCCGGWGAVGGGAAPAALNLLRMIAISFRGNLAGPSDPAQGGFSYSNSLYPL